MRTFLLLLGAIAAAALTASTSSALRIAMKPTAQRALSAEVVIVGKVTAIEKDAVEALPFPKSSQKLQFKVAVVQVESRLAGADNLTHLKVGFIPPPPRQPEPGVQPGRPGGIRPIGNRPSNTLELKAGQEFLFFLSKHPDGNFYMMPPMSPPIVVKGENGQEEIDQIKKMLAVVADPAKALKAEKAHDRYLAAATLIMKYRSRPEIPGVEIDEQPIAADESKLILQSLAEGDWTKFDRDVPNGMQAFNSLGLTPQDGFVRPRPMPGKPGQPPVNFNQVTKDAFVKWLAGPGKDYRVKKVVAKGK